MTPPRAANLHPNCQPSGLREIDPPPIDQPGTRPPHASLALGVREPRSPRILRGGGGETLGNGTRRFSNVGLVHTSEHRHTVIAAQSLEALTSLQKVDMERKRDAFMDHLKNKYPQHPPSPSPSHGSMRGTPDRTRERERERERDREQQQPNYWSFKSRSPRHSQSTQSGLADQAAKLSFASAESLETMSEADVPLGFSRMNRFRQSLPLSRSASQTKLRSPGVLFLQFGDETRRVHITHELTSLDTLHALIVHMFPQKLTLGMLKSPNTAILIKDEARNVFYELEDVRDIQDRCIIKIYRKEPIYASYPPAAHLANGDLRREMVYSSRDSSPTRRLNSLPSSASPPSGSPSRSRLSYSGGRPPSFAGPGHPHHGQHPHPHPHHGQPGGGHHPAAAGLSPSPSAILERRDVKPDEEVSGKSVVLLKNEGLYADPYGLVHEGGRLSIASTQSLAALAPDPFGFPVSAGGGGLYRRGSVRSLSTYSAAALQGELEEALYKPGGPLYAGDSYASTLGMGFRLPPSSPQKIPEMQLRDRDSYSGPPSRASPVRQTFRKDSGSSVFVESPKSRPGSSSEPLVVGGVVEGGVRGTGFGSPLAGNETETRERMEAMEKQIASLTGLVQSVLTRAPDSDSTEKTESTSDCSGTGTLTPSAPLALMPPPPPPGETAADSAARLQLQLRLHDLQHNASELRSQLSQLRRMQIQNQDSVQTLLKRTETELSVRVTDALRKQEDPLQRQRLLVEEERLKYLNEEELIIQQLHDLEKSVEEIQKDSSVNHKHVTVQELEEKAAVLRKLGETLTELKNQFPSLQSKMRVVLRVEVEAVKFLKEEPHRLDALLKRCKSITDTLATLRSVLSARRQANEGSVWKRQEELSNPSPKLQSEDSIKSGGGGGDLDMPTSPPLNLSDIGDTPVLSNWTPHTGSGSPSAPIDIRTPTLPSGPNRCLEELSMRAAERDWEEKRASLTQYSTQDINRLLEETQAELMKAIPDLDFAAKQIKPPVPAPPALPALPALQSPAHTPEHRPSKPQSHLHKMPSKEAGSRRGSDELTVARYRTEKPSKSPPPPPPRRSFPSSPGLTCRSGEVIGPGKGMKKSDSEETEAVKPHVKLRRAVSEAPRPASTPPVIATATKNEEEEEQKNTSESTAALDCSRLQQNPNALDQLHRHTPRRHPQILDVTSRDWFNRAVQDDITGSDITAGCEGQMQGVRSGQRTLEIPIATRMEGVAAGPNQSKVEQDKIDVAKVGLAEPDQAKAGQFRRSWSDDIRSSTYRRLGSLEETIRELENALQEFGVPPTAPVNAPPSTTTASPSKIGPPVPPKPKCKPTVVQPATTKNTSSGSGSAKPLHSSTAASRLKHLQQNNPEKTKTSKLRDDFLKNQSQQRQQWRYRRDGTVSLRRSKPQLLGAAALRLVIASSSSSSSSSGVFIPGLKRTPQEGALPSLSGSPAAQARALLAGLSNSSLGAEALLLSSTLRHQRLLREQRAAYSSSSVSLPNGRLASTPSSTPTSPTSPSSSAPLSLRSVPRGLQCLQGPRDEAARPEPVAPGGSE
ncbi:hypothetical protein GJAV_G00225410 [Gymnothorax javanicus]|nr:hypothetical protein GJAV_G00225410 [Gymnothorax javanicus]